MGYIKKIMIACRIVAKPDESAQAKIDEDLQKEHDNKSVAEILGGDNVDTRRFNAKGDSDNREDCRGQ